MALPLLCAAGCGSCEPPPPAGLQPFRDEWRLEADQPFPYGDAENPGITHLQIGGTPFDHNFANRGDVIVRFDGPPDRILVEVRRFTMADSVEDAADQFDGFTLWAYATSQDAPRKPSDMPEEDDCLGATWLDQCALRMYYDGQEQPSRLGADLRVTLPPSYRHELKVVTSDTDEDDDYIPRGDVCVDGLAGSLDATLHSGIAFVALADDLTPAPICSAEEIAACEGWIDAATQTAAPWHSQCGCTEFGRAIIETDGTGAADIVVDVPPSVWASLTAENQGPGQQVGGDHCTASITVPDVDLEPTGFPWRARGESNDPGDPSATEGAGFAVRAISKVCAGVARTEDPADFVGQDNGEMQHSTQRGNVRVCSSAVDPGCMPMDACDRLDELGG
jgi:hypothetical protein